MKCILLLFIFGYICSSHLSTADGPEEFFDLIKEKREVDLVLMIDRSFAMGRDNFYLVAMKLGYDIIRHHVWVDDNRVRLAVLTVSNETWTLVDAIKARDRISKCDLFPEDSGDPGEKFRWSKLGYDGDQDCVFPETVRLNAYNKADQILTSGLYYRPFATQIVILITVPICVEDYEEILTAEKQLQDNNVHVFPIELTLVDGSTARESTSWMKAVRDTPPILNYTRGGQVQQTMVDACANDTGYCDSTTGFTHCADSSLKVCFDSPCENGGTCYDDSDDQFAVCFCTWGYTGRYCETSENECDIIENACVNRVDCQHGVNSYSCINDNYMDTNPHNCSIIRDNCSDDEESVWKWVIVGIPVGICVLIVLGATLYACFMICCSRDKKEKRQKVVERVVQMRDSIHAASRNVRQSMFGGPSAGSAQPAVPPKTTRRGGTLDPEAGNRSTPVSTGTPVAIVPPTPVKPQTIPRPQAKPVQPPSIGDLQHATLKTPVPAEKPPPMTPPVPANRPPAVLLMGLMKNKNDNRESTTDYMEPEEGMGPYGRQGYDNPCDVQADEVDDDDVDEYEGEFDDFYDYAWKTGHLQPKDQYLYLVSDPSIPLPRAPVNRPDIVLDAQNSRQTRPVATDGYGWAPLQKDMLAWQNYVCDLTDSGDGMDLDRVCIMQVDGQRWIASDNSLRPTDQQLAQLWNAFHLKLRNGTEIKLGTGKERTFGITENDGVILKACGGKAGKRDEVLCVTRTKQYIVLAGLGLNNDRGQLESEVSYIRQHLLTSE